VLDGLRDQAAVTARPWRGTVEIGRRQFTRGLLLAVPALHGLAASVAAGQRDGFPDFVGLVERATPALVAIAGAKQTIGSGFFVRPNVVVTAAHVAQAAGAAIFVATPAGREPARLVATDASHDIALLEISGSAATSVLTLATAPPKVGEWIVVLGNPFGAGVTVTAGIVSAAPGAITASPALIDKLQINAAVNPGNSGGPVCNLRGEVVAVASSLVPGGQGLAFATPAAAVQVMLGRM
jgi:S1-C subfamily serine protease